MFKSHKQIFADDLAVALGCGSDVTLPLVAYPPNPDLGDLAFPCFRFAKELRKSPTAIAEELAGKLSGNETYATVEVSGGYVNVKFSRTDFAERIVNTAANSVEGLFSVRRHEGASAAVDYSSPNIAKPFGVGHLRSTMIGHSIVRMLEADGFQVTGVNHLGDWGTQFGKNIVAYLRWGDEQVVQRDPVKELFRLYVRFHEEAKDNPELEDEARLWFKKLEDGDEEATRLWKWFISESMKMFNELYGRLGVEFTHFLGESFYNDKMEAVVDELRERGLLVESDGAEVVDLSEWNMPPCIIRKSDGATIYATRDLAAANYRHDAFGADTLIYVVGAEQTLHFQQIFKVLELMQRPWASNCRHVAFGMMKFNGERLSTRRGRVVYLEEVLERAVSEARAIIEAKNPDLETKDEVAEAVGVGAVVFNDLKTYRMHDPDFRFEDVLNFDGETGPYVQYTHVRACSVLRKAQAVGVEAGAAGAGGSVETGAGGVKEGTGGDASAGAFAQVSDVEWRLIFQLAQANEVFERAVDEFDPSLMARYVLDLCHAFNRFYHDEPILSAEPVLKQQRIALCQAVKSVIAYALFLLGLKAPEAM